jgi:hypothetical protein
MKSKYITVSIPEDIYKFLRRRDINVSGLSRQLFIDYFNRSNPNEIHFDSEFASIDKIDLVDRTIHFTIPDYIQKSMKMKSNKVFVKC